MSSTSTPRITRCSRCARCALSPFAPQTPVRAPHPFLFFRSPPTRSFPFLFARAARQGAPQGRGGRANAAREDGQLAAEVEHVQVIGARVAERAREPVVKQSNNLRDEKLEKSSRVRCFLHASRKDVKRRHGRSGGFCRSRGGLLRCDVKVGEITNYAAQRT